MLSPDPSLNNAGSTSQVCAEHGVPEQLQQAMIHPSERGHICVRAFRGILCVSGGITHGFRNALRASVQEETTCDIILGSSG